MPLTSKGQAILKSLQAEYGAEKGESVLYAGKNSGRFTGIDGMPMSLSPNAAIPWCAIESEDVALDDATGHAAGVICVSPRGRILLLHRSPEEKNFAGHWGWPGGGVDAGETPEEGARRELHEEVGYVPGSTAPFVLVGRKRTPTGMVFTTFAHPVSHEFVPSVKPDEHTGYTWADLRMLPRPMHPAVEGLLSTRIGVATDMKPEEWQGLVHGLLTFLSEEAAEPEHQAHDTITIALDEASARFKDKDGHLHVSKLNISKATVNPYRGAEIPGFERLGLDPERIYQLLRHPEELEKAAATSNGKPILRIHKGTTADSHQTEEVVGALMRNAAYEHPYVTNGAVFWPAADIDMIEDGSKREVSMGYRYTPVMTPGEYEGQHFDGVMTDIVFNHMAQVEEGRAGSDVCVPDEALDSAEWRAIEEAILAIAAEAA